MAKRGRAGPALATAAIGSFVAGTIATVLLTLLAPVVVEIALKFGPAEYFALMVLAFVTVAAVLGPSTSRGLTMLFLGLLIGLVGIDEQTGQQRFTFGVPELLDGIDVVVLAVGLFAVGETLYVAALQQPAARRDRAAVRLADDVEGRLAALVAGVAARHGRSAFRSARSRPAAPRSRPSCPMRWRASSARSPKSSARARSRAWPGPRPRTTRRRPGCWCRC